MIWQWLKYAFAISVLVISGCTAVPAADNGRIAYLSWDEDGRIQLYTTSRTKQTPEQRTEAPADIHSYAISPDGSQIVYGMQFDNGRSQLWLLNINQQWFSSSPKELLTCENALCSLPTWAPDNRRIIYEKRETVDGEPGLPTLWWLDSKTGETITVLAEATPPNQAASVSPDGSWLSYASPVDEGVYVYHFENGRFFLIPSQLTNQAAWHPNSRQLITNDFNIVIFHEGEELDHQAHDHDFAQAIHLYVTDIASEQRRQLTEGGSMDDSTPVWSPNGEWVAFGRKLLNTPTGRQLWLVRADGSEAHALTDQLLIHHGAVSWDEDGRFLLYQRFDTQQPDIPPSIHTIDINSGEISDIAPAGFQPMWIPGS